jgi:protein-tyrosine kinase
MSTPSKIAPNVPLRTKSVRPPVEPATAPRSVSTVSFDVPCRRGAEQYDMLLWRLHSVWKEQSAVGFIVGVMNCGRRCGGTTLAANLAIRAADHHMGPVLLIDANHRHPQLRELIRVDRGAGLADILAARATVAQCAQHTSVQELDVLTSGDPRSLEAGCFDPSQLEALFAECRVSYAVVVVDLPAVPDLGDGTLFARLADGNLLIVRSERVKREEAQRAVASLAVSDIPLLGVVITDQRRYVPDWLDRRL